MPSIDFNGYKIYENVKIGVNALIGENVVIGIPPMGKKIGELETIIGDNTIIRAGTIIYAGNKIGSNFQSGHLVVIRENNVIGDNVSIGTQSNIEYLVKIGNCVRIHSGVFVPEYSVLEDYCWIGPHVVLTNALYPTFEGVKENLIGPRICSYARVGANSTILPGLTIGRNSLVGAGSVVTKDVEENSIVCGNPAKFLKKIQEVGYGKKNPPC